MCAQRRLSAATRAAGSWRSGWGAGEGCRKWGREKGRRGSPPPVRGRGGGGGQRDAEPARPPARSLPPGRASALTLREEGELPGSGEGGVRPPLPPPPPPPGLALPLPEPPPPPSVSFPHQPARSAGRAVALGSRPAGCAA